MTNEFRRNPDRQGRPNEALKSHQEMLATSHQEGNRLEEANQLGEISNILFGQGKFEEVLRHYKEALAIHRERDHRLGEALDLGNIGNVYYLLPWKA